ncbi:glucose-inhibited division protein A [Clostridium cellulovorans 743B]|uniref:Glucose-inhibited division protein A n=1 Tax=Clostridium cellulovorans (strain ATCC 35296 / DSM 3052 / OCM 3 / 743B) TaxID=573061 RepID=D9SPU6_CLOC7|nr:glucose-inhibited division protein A [Clostridium cellulovorans 743B]
MKVVVIGGGWGGCSAALVAKKIGAEVELYEKTDMLLGLGNVGGIIRNNGRYTAAEELIALGAGDLVEICDSTSRHTNVYFPGNDHASLYDVNKIEPLVKKKLEDEGINIFLRTRAIDVKCSEGKIESVVLSDGTSINADVFIEATGSTGPMGNCLKYGNGCVMCILRCPCFGPRVSLSARAGIPDLQGMRADDIFGAMSGSCKLMKETLSEEIVKELDEKGLVILKVPEEDVNMDKLKSKVCQQYALKEFAENLILLDTGNAR